MAASPATALNPLKQVEKEITCTLCNDHYKQPKLLPCNHFFCGECIEREADKSPSKSLSCPECKKTTTLPPGGVAELNSSLLKFMERKIKMYDITAKASGKGKAACGQCAGTGTVTAFCSDCADFVCGDCEKLHRKPLAVFAQHRLIPLDKLKNGDPKAVPLKAAPLPLCPDHDKPMEMFCFHCNCLICLLCLSYDHRKHKVATDVLKKCAAETRDGVRESLTKLQVVQSAISDAKTTIGSEETKAISWKEEVCELIQHSFDQIKEDLDQRKEELITTTRTLSQTKEGVLRDQRRGLQAALKEIESLTNLVDHNLESVEHQDLMSVHVKLRTMVEEAITQHSQVDLTPATSDNIICNPPTKESIPKELGAVFLSSERSGIHVALPKICRVGESTQFTVKVPQSMGTNVHVQLKSLVKPLCFIEASILPSAGHDTYSLTYTPQVRGRHDLTVKVNGKEIDGSPFSVFVNIDPNLLGQPQFIITGLNQPWGVAFTSPVDRSEQQLVVTEAGGKKITMMKRNGERVQTIECGDLHGLRGVAVGPDGDIFVVDKTSKSLCKFSRNGERTGTIGGFNDPTFIEIVQNQIYVPENASSEIKIVDIDSSEVNTIHPCPRANRFTIGSGASPCPKGIAENDGKLFVAEGKKRGVYRYDLGNAPIAHFSVKGLSKSESSKGICFDSNAHLFMVMTGKNSNGVYVYRSDDGEFVTSFGFDHLGSAAGIAIDDDGFVYVCDFINEGKIFVF